MGDATQQCSPRPFELLAGFGEPEPVETLAARLQRLDRASWQTLWVQHRRLVRGVLAFAVGYGGDIDDLAHEVFLTAIRLVQSGRVVLVDEGPGIRAWLVAIAQQLARTERRRRVKARSRAHAPDVEGIAGPPPNPTDGQLLERARVAIMTMPPHLSLPLFLRHVEQMSLDEIASVCAVSVATVKRRLVRAAELFRRLAARDPVLRERLMEKPRHAG